jgi:hypothetical protein
MRDYKYSMVTSRIVIVNYEQKGFEGFADFLNRR